MDRGSDSNQRVETSNSLPVHPNTTVSSRLFPDKTFMKTVSRRKSTPIGHGVTGVWLTDAAFVLNFFDNRKVARRSFSSGTANVRLCGHEQSIAFQHVYGLRAFRELHLHHRLVVRFIGNDVISAPSSIGRSTASGLATSKQRNGDRHGHKR